ncbi:hypothetical protein G6027_00025 [Dietzia sp. SLG310A2-38A2]|uniref:hypothetical protein n=1 Tax=Dietzia sp. SLG310A2-38A2 TaxID=1630643 RepID=UPI0015FAB194|nr:hypothetical protein [Dietzia sp. SLG310A2-38A2]MBB1029297.1 hypothetical protein [Dietzia sp. SLG310A2-38A2]
MRILAALAPVLLTAAACMDGGGAGDEAESTSSPGSTETSEAGLEMALLETCPRDSDSQCVSIHGENVLVDPSGFEHVGVEAADQDSAGAIGVTLDNAGAGVVRRLTMDASHAGENARLVTRVDTELLSAVRVRGEFHGAHLLITIPPDVDAVAVAEKLNGGAD